MIVLDQSLECVHDLVKVFINDNIYVLGVKGVTIFEDRHHAACVADVTRLAVPKVNNEHNAFLLSGFPVEWNVRLELNDAWQDGTNRLQDGTWM